MIVRSGYADRRNDYGYTHRNLRRNLHQSMLAGAHYDCPHCGNWVNPLEPWELDHAPDRVSYRGPAHTLCNRRNTGL
jgi:hypothetical protein